MAIPTHPSLLPAARIFLQTLLDRNLIGLAPQKCAWSSSLFFVRKPTKDNIVENLPQEFQNKDAPKTRVSESGKCQERDYTSGIGPPDQTQEKRTPKRGGPKKAPKAQNEQKDTKIPDIRAILDLRAVNNKLKSRI